MSLDVYLTMNDPHPIAAGSGIFVRQNGQTLEISRAEWDEKFPDREPIVNVHPETESNEVFNANITHNMSAMATEAGIYEHLWRPEEIGISKAAQLIEPMRAGLQLMESEPERFAKHNPSSGWGSYAVFVPWIREYLAACEEYPDADVKASR